VYSYIVGSIAGMLSNLDMEQTELNQKIDILNRIQLRYNLSPLLYKKILNALEYEQKYRSNRFNELLDSLPHGIKNEMLSIMHE
jgi:hypothetical protein